MKRALLAACGAGVFLLTGVAPHAQPARKRVLAWADVRYGYQHDSISHAIATIERLGRDSGAYDTFIRTDSQLITKHPISLAPGTQKATGEGTFNLHNLDYFDAIFFFGVREIELSADQRADLLAFIRDDGKGLIVAHSGLTAFFSWPEFGDMVGARFDEHPWNIIDGSVVVDDAGHPAMRHLPPRSVFRDELYQLKDFSRDKIHVLAHLDSTKLDLTNPLVHRKDADFPAAWSKSYGKGRVFASILGHAAENWDDARLQQMYLQAIRWSLHQVE